MDDGSASLVTAAQALHWFELEKFYSEAFRVLAPGGVLACWGYATNILHDDNLDAAVDGFYNGLLGAYWCTCGAVHAAGAVSSRPFFACSLPTAPRRKLVEAEFRGLEPTPASGFIDGVRTSVPMSKAMPLSAFMGYLSTWSAYQTYRRRHPSVQDPLVPLQAKLLRLLGPDATPGTTLNVTWPTFLLMYRKPM